MKETTRARIAVLSMAVLAATLGGCVGYGDGPPPVYHEPWFVPQAGYVYYPDYQVYYSRSRHNFVYPDGTSWVTRPAPPRVAVDVLFASPSVRFDFRHSPSIYHSQVARQYPRHSTPSSPGPDLGRVDGRGR